MCISFILIIKYTVFLSISLHLTIILYYRHSKTETTTESAFFDIHFTIFFLKILRLFYKFIFKFYAEVRILLTKIVHWGWPSEARLKILVFLLQNITIWILLAISETFQKKSRLMYRYTRYRDTKKPRPRLEPETKTRNRDRPVSVKNPKPRTRQRQPTMH